MAPLSHCFEIIHKRGLAAAPAGGLLLGGMRRPRGKGEQLKGGGDAAFRIGVAFLIEGGGAQQGGAAAKGAAAGGERIGFAHGPQFTHQRECVRVRDGQQVAIDDGQGEPGPLQQAARIAHLHEGGDARADAALDLQFRVGEAGTQFLQRARPRNDGEKQPVRLQGTAQLDERAGEVVHPMQIEGAEDGVEGALAKGQPFLIRDEPQAGGRQHGRRGVGLHQLRDAAAPGQRLGKDALMRAKREGVREAVRQVVQPVRQPLRGFAHEKIHRAETGCAALTPGAPEGAVKDVALVLHGGQDTAMSAKIKGYGAGAARLLADVLWPPRCALCRTAVDAAHTLCGECFGTLHFIAAPQCRCCGLPFSHAPAGELLCGECAATPPPYDCARAALLYDDASRPLVTRLKYGDQPQLALLLARWMRLAGHAALEGAEAIVPVPLHWRRMLARRYNQSLMLARELGTLSGLPVRPEWLVRRKATTPQVGLSRAQRRRNVAAAFAVPQSSLPLVKGKRLVLVDDVMTSGATLQACTRVLRRAGAAEIRVLTLARRAQVD